MELRNGHLVKSYEIVEQLGKGGFGAVYRAYQPIVGRDVAIKVILPQHANQPDFVRRFESEAQFVARLEHPHIVPLYDYWREPNSAFLVMRYLKGGSLRQLLEAGGGLSLERTIQMLTQIGSALSLAHQYGVIHRDIKTDNILLDEQGNFYLADFGIAKDSEQNSNLTRDSILGTPAYLSPEQIRGEVATVQSDIYAFGILTYETLTASKPFYDLTPASVLFKQLNEPLPDLRTLRADLPESINGIVQRATAKDPFARYNDIVSFVRDMQSLMRALMPETGTGTQSLSITDMENALLNLSNPYKGLRAFQQGDADDFYGREALVQRLVERLRPTTPQGAFLAVVGASGSGKSSVVKAGLMPLVQRNILDPKVTWYALEIVPSTHPLEELEHALLSIATREIPDMLKQLKEDTRGAVRMVRRILPENSQLLLLIDQFEEVFTLVEDEAERQHFLDSLYEIIHDARSQTKLVITLRADFYDRLLTYARFGELLLQRTELVLPMRDEELETSIIKPSERVGLKLENGLVSTIVQDVSEQPGALPLLQYALTELFERREGSLLTLKAYHDIGGVTGALARRAEELYTHFSASAQETARQMFLRLVTLGEGSEDTRRRIFQSELLTLMGNAERMREVIDTFGKYRLLTFDHDPITRASTVEVAHEALIRRWERMKSWLEDNRDALRIHRRLISAADEWRNSQAKDKSLLARGSRLQQFSDLARNPSITLNESERAYLQASQAEADGERIKEETRQAREAQLERQARTRLRLLAIVSMIAALVGIVLASVAILQSQAASQAQSIAEDKARETASLALAANARSALSENDPRLALALALEASNAYQPAPAEVLRTLARTVYAPNARRELTQHDQSVLETSFSPDGRYALLAGINDYLSVIDLETGQLKLRIDLPDLFSLDADFSPDGTVIAAALSDDSIRLFNVSDGAEIGQLLGHQDRVMDIEFHPSYPQVPQLISASLDRSARLWDTRTQTSLREFTGNVGGLLRVEFSADGTQIVTGAVDATIFNDPNDAIDRSVTLWDVATGAELWRITPSSGFVRSLDFSPRGDLIAVGVWDSANAGTARLYNAQTGEEVRRLFTANDNISDLHFNQNGTRLVLVSWDKSVHLWDVDRGVELQTFTGFPERLLSVDMSANGQQLLIAQGNVGNNEILAEREQAIDTSVWLWDLASSDQIRTLTGHQDWLWAGDISPDGTRFATGSGALNNSSNQGAKDNSVRLWNAQTGEQIGILQGHSNTVDSLDWHPDGVRLLSGAWDNEIILWDSQTEQELRRYTGHSDQVFKVRFNQDGTQFVSASRDKTLRLWDTETGAEIRRFEGHTDAVNSVSYSPDGRFIASASTDQSLRLWDVATGAEIRRFEGHTQQVNEVIFSPDGRYLFSSSWDDSVRQWDLATGAEIRQFVGHTSNTFGLALSADGQMLFSTSADRSIRLWDTHTGDELHRFIGHSDWVQEVGLSPDERWVFSVAQDRSARQWRVNRSVETLQAFALETRAIRIWSCAERIAYRLDACPVN